MEAILGEKQLLFRPCYFCHDPTSEIPVNIFEPLLSVGTLWLDHVKVEIETEDEHVFTQCEYKNILKI